MAKLPEPVREWMLEQLHLATDNLHIQNIGQPVLSVSLYTWSGGMWDKGTWAEQSLGELNQGQHQWFTLTPLTPALLIRPAGESVLVVRAQKTRTGQTAIWRVDNVSSLLLQRGMYEPSGGFSFSGGAKLLLSGYLKPKTSGHHCLAAHLGNLNAHLEYWFDAGVMTPTPAP